MPKIEEYCEVRTTSGIYRDWTNVVVTQSYSSGALPRVFRLQVAEPDAKVLRLKPGDRVDIALAGQVFIQEGYIKTRQVSYDANRHGVQVDGYSKDGPITEASLEVDGGQYQGYKFDAIAKSVLKKHGLSFKMEGLPPGADEAFRSVMIHHGERPIEFLERLAFQRGLRLSSDADGTITAGSDIGSGQTTLEEGVNIVAATSLIEMPGVDQVIARSQAQGSDSLFGRKAAEISAKGTIPDGPQGTKRIVLAEEPLSQKELQTRANMEIAEIEASRIQVSVTHQGWLKPGGSTLWRLRDKVSVVSPMLFPTEGGKLGSGEMSELVVFGMTYSQDSVNGTTTTLNLVNRAAFSLHFTDASGNSDYNPPATEAKPEAPT
jgi:prophage tail gpP-like protein